MLFFHRVFCENGQKRASFDPWRENPEKWPFLAHFGPKIAKNGHFCGKSVAPPP